MAEYVYIQDYSKKGKLGISKTCFEQIISLSTNKIQGVQTADNQNNKFVFSFYIIHNNSPLPKVRRFCSADLILFCTECFDGVFLCGNCRGEKSRNKRKQHTDNYENNSALPRQLSHSRDTGEVLNYNVYGDIQQERNSNSDSARRKSNDKRFGIEHVGDIAL